MFNIHLYESKIKNKIEIDQTKAKYLQDQLNRKQKNEKLSQNYRKRCENFVVHMLENPIKVTDFKFQTHRFREDERDKFIGDSQIQIKGFKNEKDRIKASQQQNQDLDFFPNQTTFNFQYRPRSLDKEIQPDLKFQAKTSLDRIKQQIQNQVQAYVKEDELKYHKKIVYNGYEGIWNNEKVMSQSFQKLAIMAHDAAKNLLPSLHQKTHFQAAQIMFNNQGLSLGDLRQKQKSSIVKPVQLFDDSKEIDQKFQVHKSSFANKNHEQGAIAKAINIAEKNQQMDTNTTGPRQQQTQIESFNPIQASRKILQDCNVIKEKNTKVQWIHPGNGHLMGLNDMSVTQIYEQLYPKNNFNNPKKHQQRIKKIQSLHIL